MLVELVERAFGPEPGDEMLAWSWATTPIEHFPSRWDTVPFAETTVAHYRAAVDERRVEVKNVFDSTCETVVLFELSGRHVGSLGSVVATGRLFSTFGMAVEFHEPSTDRRFAVQSALLARLTERGRHSCWSNRPETTLWARAWKLPPRLARLAVLLASDASVAQVAEDSLLSMRSVRTYTEQLFGRIGIQSRAQLGPLLLRAGTAETRTRPSGVFPVASSTRDDSMSDG